MIGENDYSHTALCLHCACHLPQPLLFYIWNLPTCTWRTTLTPTFTHFTPALDSCRPFSPPPHCTLPPSHCHAAHTQHLPPHTHQVVCSHACTPPPDFQFCTFLHLPHLIPSYFSPQHSSLPGWTDTFSLSIMYVCVYVIVMFGDVRCSTLLLHVRRTVGYKTIATTLCLLLHASLSRLSSLPNPKGGCCTPSPHPFQNNCSAFAMTSAHAPARTHCCGTDLRPHCQPLFWCVYAYVLFPVPHAISPCTLDSVELVNTCRQADPTPACSCCAVPACGPQVTCTAPSWALFPTLPVRCVHDCCSHAFLHAFTATLCHPSACAVTCWNREGATQCSTCDSQTG